jgi:DNA-binding transcriptional LysR family regulator
MIWSEGRLNFKMALAAWHVTKKINLWIINMLKLSQFEAFHAVMTSGSMTEAAKILNTSQPNISRSIAKLEQASELILFERLPGKLVPTSDGIALFEEVKRSFFGLQKLKAATSRIRRSGSGALRIGAVQSHSTSMVPRAISKFSDKFPDASLSIHTGHSSLLVQMVREHSCDLAIVSHLDENDGVESEILYDASAVCIMPASHPLAKKTIVTPLDIVGERFVSLPKGEKLRVDMDSVFKMAGVEAEPNIETSYSSITCSLVQQGVGIALVNRFVALGYFNETVAVRPFSQSLKHQAIVVYPSGKTLNRFSKAFVDSLKHTVSQQQSELKMLNL